MTQVRKASAFAAPTEAEVELAEEIMRRLPSLGAGCGSRTPARRRRCSRSGGRGRSPGRDLVARFDQRLPRDPRHGPRRTRPASRPAIERPRRRSAVGRPDGVERSSPAASASLAAIIIEPVQGAGGVRAADPSVPPVPARARDAHRRAADLRRDHRVPGRAGTARRASSASAPDLHDARQDRRRRLRARGVRRLGPRSWTASTPGGRAR